MKLKSLILASFAAVTLGVGSALAGPCDTTGRSANRDAGSGPTVGSAGQTSGMTNKDNEHPPTSTMNRTTGDVAASSQDAQKQMQGQPTAAQQAEGAQFKGQTADKGC